MTQPFGEVSGFDPAVVEAARRAMPDPFPLNLGVAISGGSDSLALLHVFAQLAAEFGGTLHAVTVDHALRPESADEARFVAGISAGLGVSHETLRWDHGDISGNLQDQARRARYRLIADWARGRGIAHVALGHTADDQAETFLMRLARGAGIDGLAAMRPCWTDGGVMFLRPLLGQTRAELRAGLTRIGQVWIDDPSNENARFDRIKARRALAHLKPLGLTAETLSAVARNLADARHALDLQCVDVAGQIATTEAGDVVLDRTGLLALAPEIRRRLLIGALKWVSGAEYPPRAHKILTLESAIAEGRAATLGGCRIMPEGGNLRIYREARALAGVDCATDALWDNRWAMDGPHSSDLQIRALGVGGLRECPDWRRMGHPRASLLASPAIWRNQTLIAAPLAGYCNGWSARIVADFKTALLSH